MVAASGEPHAAARGPELSRLDDDTAIGGSIGHGTGAEGMGVGVSCGAGAVSQHRTYFRER